MFRPAWLAGVCALATLAGAQVSQSKIGTHLLGGTYTLGARQVVAAGPKVVKVMDLHRDMLIALEDYKRQYPDGVTVLRIWTPRKWTLEMDPERSADEFWSEVLWSGLSQLTPRQRELIDYLEGPNEGDSTPTWFSLDQVRWFNRFWLRLTERMVEHGFKPCIGSIAVGQPPGSMDEMGALLAEFVPALRAAHRAGGLWSYHAYTIAYTTDPEGESWYALRHRRIRANIVRAAPDLAEMPCVITEGGVDYAGNRAKDGWQARGNAARYQRWLRWFDRELRKDEWVVGVTLFQQGDPWWGSFDIDPIADWLAGYLEANRKGLAHRRKG